MPAPETLEIYVDESNQTKHRFLVLGGTIVPQVRAEETCNRINARRRPELPHGELKWTKVSAAKLDAYTRVVDSFFLDAEFHDCEFHAVVVDTSRLDHKAFNAGSSEVGFNKEIYQLASKVARLHPQPLLHLYLDKRSTSQSPSDLRTILNMGRRKVGDRRDWPFRRCHFRDSKHTPLLWLSDLFAGAIAFHLNGHRTRSEASPAKCSLADHILARAGVSDPSRDTPITGKFTIWHRRLR